MNLKPQKLSEMKVSDLMEAKIPKPRIICDGTWCLCNGNLSTTPYGAYKQYMVSVSIAQSIGREVFSSMDWSFYK